VAHDAADVLTDADVDCVARVVHADRSAGYCDA
jgi:hypothetical protein